MKGLVSIILLSRNKEHFLEASVRSVMEQTYQNWELLFVDDDSHDDTISVLLKLKEEDRRRFRKIDMRSVNDGETHADRINITKTTYYRGKTHNRNAALQDANGKWVAFMDAGDIWEPTKLEKQVAFMEENGYSFSYTMYKTIGAENSETGLVMSGPEHISYKDMKKCCWLLSELDADRGNGSLQKIVENTLTMLMLVQTCEFQIYSTSKAKGLISDIGSLLKF